MAVGKSGRASVTARSRVRSPRSVHLRAEVRHRLNWLIGVLGNNATADLLGVSRSQPSRWRTGAEGLAARNERAVLDLDYVIARLHQVWEPGVAAIWLDSPNAYLAGATPLNVLRQRGIREVITAIDAEAQAAYA